MGNKCESNATIISVIDDDLKKMAAINDSVLVGTTVSSFFDRRNIQIFFSRS